MARMDARTSSAAWLVAVLAWPVAASAATPAPLPAPSGARSGPPEPQVRRAVLEDDHVRIEELKVRGQVQRITVSPKASGVRPYEIVPPDAGHDPSQPSKGLSGQRLWRLLSF